MVHTFPRSRLGTIDLGRVAAGRHHVAGLLEIDVTDALAAAGPGDSIVPWFIATMAQCLVRYPRMHALRGRGRRLFLSDAVDCVVMLEKKVERQRVPLPLVIRGAETKSASGIAAEIRAAQRQPVDGRDDVVLGDATVRGMGLWYRLPGLVRAAIMRGLLRVPGLTRKMMGTVLVTSLSSFTGLSGWILPKTMHPLCFAIGAVSPKPWVVDGKVVIRSIMNLTVLFDHDVVDGAPAARFLEELTMLLEGRPAAL